ncbi:MAG: hypothetical protein KatS3mg109_0056 [Pirellulaceae bacterium]|nr:MAG: hypothetical protein KatS3mg109_0056 [Pirellulaceae bacterium]
MENKIASALGVDVQEAAALPDLVTTQVFFAKLAELGYRPANDREAQALLEIAAQVAEDPQLEQAKLAASPEEAAELVNEVQVKTAAFMEDPVVFASALALFAEAKLAEDEE